LNHVLTFVVMSEGSTPLTAQNLEEFHLKDRSSLNIFPKPDTLLSIAIYRGARAVISTIYNVSRPISKSSILSNGESI
jgi:hypothetical protein